MTLAPEYLFVYGTLMRGYNNTFAKKRNEFSHFVGHGSFPGYLYLVDWYPGATYCKESIFTVFGEVYEIKDATSLMKELDEYEDVFEDENSSLYVRRIVSVKMENQSLLDSWVYLYNQSVADLKQIESGNFRDIGEI